jgi:cell division septal protein FtsQ
MIIAFAVLFVVTCAALIYGLWQRPVRISHVVVYGADQSLAELATLEMQGSYFGIPRDSIFFLPEASIRARIMSAHPEIAAVSIFRSGLTTLSIRVDHRVAIARWCGLAPTKGVEEYCYVFDANGYVFAAAASTTPTVNTFALYTHPVGDTLEPLRATLTNVEQLPMAFEFARKLATFGSPVVRVIMRDGEVDDDLASGTRVTYELGNEEQAYTALASARANFNLADGTVDYVDLRFPGKVYLKKK